MVNTLVGGFGFGFGFGTRSFRILADGTAVESASFGACGSGGNRPMFFFFVLFWFYFFLLFVMVLFCFALLGFVFAEAFWSGGAP